MTGKRQRWDITFRDPNQLAKTFATERELSQAINSMTALALEDRAREVWASGDFYDIEAQVIEDTQVGFLICPTVESGSTPPAICLPYSASELVALVASELEIVAAEGDCSTCNEQRRGRSANRDVANRPLFLCSTCEQWTQTLPTLTSPGPRSRPSGLSNDRGARSSD